MKLRDIAKEVRELLQGNSGWVVLYRDGRRWEYIVTNCYGNATNHYAWKFDNEEQRQQLLNILEVDPNAIILNGFAVGVAEGDERAVMSIDTLTAELKSTYLFGFGDRLRLSDHKESITNAKVTDYYAQPVGETTTRFEVGMQFGSVEVSKRTDRTVYLKSLENGLTTKKKVKTKDFGEYVDVDVDTCEWLGIAQDEQFFRHCTFHADKYRNALVYRLSPRGGGLDG